MLTHCRRTRSLILWYDERAQRRSIITRYHLCDVKVHASNKTTDLDIWITNPAAAGVLPADTRMTAYIILSRLVQDGIINMV